MAGAIGGVSSVPTWAEIGTAFHVDRSVDAIRGRVRASGIDFQTYERVVSTLDTGRNGADETLGALWRGALDSPGEEFLLAFALYAEVQHAWELTADTQRIRPLVEAIPRSWRLAGSCRNTDGTEGRLVRVLVEHTSDLSSCFDMEVGLNCSCPIAVSEAAAFVANRAAELAGDLIDVEEDWEERASLVSRVLEVHKTYFDGLSRFAGCMLAVIGGEAGQEDISRTAEMLSEIERRSALAPDVYESELRAHVLTLNSLSARLRTTTVGQLVFPEAEAIYLFPFTTHGAEDGLVEDNRALIRALREIGPRLQEGNLPINSVEDVKLSDIWSHGRSKVLNDQPVTAAAYEMVRLVLPSVSIGTTAGTVLGPLSCEVRFSSLGNHHVIIRGELQDREDKRAPNFHDLNQAIRRGSGFMGAEKVRLEGLAVEFMTVADLARAIVKEISDWGEMLGMPGFACYFDVAVDAHALLSLHRADVRDETGKVRTASGREILEALGPLLLIPVERSAASLEEWLRYHDPVSDAEIPNFLGDLAPIDSLAVQTPRSTCVYAPGLPEWSMLGTNELVEFVVSVRALMRQWVRTMHALIDEAMELLELHLDGRDLDSDLVRQMQLRLAHRAAVVRQQRALLHSEELARSPGHRQTLDHLLSTSRTKALEAEVDDSITELDALYTQIRDDATMIEGRRATRYQAAVGLVLYILTLVSLADLVAFSNDVVFPNGVPRAWLIREFIAFGVAFLALSAWGWRGYRRTKR